MSFERLLQIARSDFEAGRRLIDEGFIPQGLTLLRQSLNAYAIALANRLGIPVQSVMVLSSMDFVKNIVATVTSRLLEALSKTGKDFERPLSGLLSLLTPLASFGLKFDMTLIELFTKGVEIVKSFVNSIADSIVPKIFIKSPVRAEEVGGLLREPIRVFELLGVSTQLALRLGELLGEALHKAVNAIAAIYVLWRLNVLIEALELRARVKGDDEAVKEEAKRVLRELEALGFPGRIEELIKNA